MLRYTFFIIFFSTAVSAQTSKLEGYIFDKSTGDPLSFASIRIDGTTSGTAANIDGLFYLRLKKGDYKLIFSFIGYKTDTLSIKIPTNYKIKIGLVPQSLWLEEVVVDAGEDPAYRIIREAIKRKKANKKGLVNYSYHAFSKRIILSADELAVIEETLVKGYHKIDSWSKEFILSTHKTENRKKEIQTMDFSITEDYYLDFSTDTLRLLNNLVYLPLYFDAFDYYDYKLLKIMESDDGVDYYIEVIPLSQIQPLLEGEIVIESKSYSLKNINLQTNDGVRFPYVNDFKVKFIQQQGKYEGYWLPNYVELKARLSINVGGLISIEPMSFNQFSNITEYDINGEIPDSIENAVKSKYGYFTADTTENEPKPLELTREEIDSLREIPLTKIESEAYVTLDSTKTIEKMIKVGGALSVLVPDPDEEEDTTDSFIGGLFDAIGTYGHFRNNRVNGLLFGVRYNDRFISDDLNLKTSAGFTPLTEKFEWDIGFNYWLEDFIISRIEIGAFEYAKMWQKFTPYPDIVNGISVTIGFEDQFNYYQAKGFNFGIARSFGDSFFSKLSFVTEKQSSLEETKYQSIFNSNRLVKENPEILEGYDNRLSLFFEIGKNPMTIQPIPESGLIAQFDLSDPSFRSDFSYRFAHLIGMLKTKTFYKELFVAPYLQILFDGGIVNGDFGPQQVLTPTSVLAFYSPLGSFKGLKPYQFVGTEMAAIHLEHNWRTIPFQSVGLDFITDMHIDLITGFSGLNMWNHSNYLTDYKMNKPYWEAYIGISRIFAFLRFDITYNSLDRFHFTAAIATIL